MENAFQPTLWFSTVMRQEAVCGMSLLEDTKVTDNVKFNYNTQDYDSN